jgi:eukaryotic-like serine/threonine-protein kinase
MIHSKNVVSLCAVVVLICVALACNKTISTDTALPVTTGPSVLLPTQNGIIYSIDANTGAKNWELHDIDSSDISSNSYNKTLACDDENNFFIPVRSYKSNETFKYYIACVKAGNKELKWKAFIPYNRNNNNVGLEPTAPLTYGNGMVFVPCEDSLFAFDKTGALKWRHYTGNVISSAPLYAEDGLLYVLTQDKVIRCIDPSNGSLYSNVGLNLQNPYTIGVASLSGYSNVSYSNNRLYVGIDNSAAGGVVCLKSKLEKNGSNPEIWNYSVPSKSTFASPLVYGDMCIMGAHDFNIHCIDGTAGVTSVRWKFPTAERINSSAIVDELRENIIVGSNDFNLYAINFVNGKLRWKFPTGSMIVASPTLYNGNVYCTSLDKYLYCIDGANGTLKWKTNLNLASGSGSNPALFMASPVVVDMNNKAYYPTVSGTGKY